MPRDDIIYSREYPEERPENFLREAEAHAGERDCSAALAEAVAALGQKRVYTPIPGAESAAKLFAEYAVYVSESYRLDTTVRRLADGVEVSMRLSCGLYDGPVKRALERLMRVSDEVSLIGEPDEPGLFRLDMRRYTHEAVKGSL